jgi:hypothetical protein
MSHEINGIAEAETVSVSEGSMSGTVIARCYRSAGVDEHIACKRKTLEPRKPHSVLRQVIEGSVEQGMTVALRHAALGWRTEV